MADTTISDLPAAGGADGAVLPVEVDGTKYRITLAQLIAAIQAAAGNP